MLKKYRLQFDLHSSFATADGLKSALAEFAESVLVTEAGREGPGTHKEFGVSLCTEDPTLVFDACSRFGRIKSVKVHEQS